MQRNTLYRAIATALAAGSLTACGGGGGGGETAAGPTSTTTVGVISGFGSVYVGGVRFDTSSARYSVDDDDAFDDSALGVGMKVKVKGSKNPDGLTGTADAIYYDDDLDGPIENLAAVDPSTRSFTIFGQTVIVDATRTVFDDLSFETLANGQDVEVSGYFENGDLIATRVELEDGTDDDYEVKGRITNYVSNTGFDLLLPSGTVVPVIIDASTTYDPDLAAGLSDGLYVEVEGSWDGSSLTAAHIDDEDELLSDDDDDVELKGTLSGDAGTGWFVKGIEIVLTGATEYEPSSLEDNLVAGMEVEVDGYMQGGVLIAEDIEAYEDDIDLAAPVLSVSYEPANPKSGSLTLGFPNAQSLEVFTDNATLFKDESSMDDLSDDDDSFSLNELGSSGEFVEIEAYLAGDGRLVATTLSREDETSDTELEAPVEAFTPNADVTLLGITWTVDGSTRYGLDDSVTDATGFWDAIQVGMELEVEDEYSTGMPADGVADRLELDTRDDD
jgi:hypothetical protein